jgi:mannosyltransferase OCH1-like enzyme
MILFIVIIIILVILFYVIKSYNQENFTAITKPYIWLYWENKPGVDKPPTYIQMCHESVKQHCSDKFNVIILNENSVNDYLFNLRTDIQELSIPQKADYIRLKLLEKYGGIWLDSDIIVMQDLMPIIDKMKNGIDFVGFGCHSYNCRNSGKPKPANWVMASKPHTEFIKECIKQCDETLDKGVKGIKYFALGRNVLWDCIKKMKKMDSNWDYYHYDSKCLDRDSNYRKMRNHRMISEEGLDNKCINQSLFIPIYNTAPGFPDWFKNLSKDELLEKDMLISKIFRKSLFKHIN